MKNFYSIMNTFAKVYFISIICIFCKSTNLIGQLEYTTDYTFFVEQGQPFSQEFKDQNNTSSTGWSISPDNLGISFDGTILKGNINYILQSNDDYPVRKNITISHNGIQGGVNTNLMILRPGIDIVLVLDRSGSMAQTNLTSGGVTKWNVLTASVQNFLTAYNLFPSEVDGSAYVNPKGCQYSLDKIGVVYFDHENSTYSYSNLKTINPDSQTSIPNPTVEINGNMTSNVAPRGTTCLGGGVIEAHKLLFASNAYKNKHIIAFTDGLQNRNPVYDQNQNIIHKNTTIALYDGFNVDLSLNFNNLGTEKFKIHTICIGDNANADLMQNLALANPDDNCNGEFKHANTTSGFDYSQLDVFFTETWVDILKPFSPAIVNRENFEMYEDYIDKKFHVNATADKILIKVVGIPEKLKNLIMYVKKDEKTFPQRYYQYSGSMKYFFVDKKSLDSLGITIGGEWRITLKGEKGASYTITNIVNDEYIDYECDVDKLNFIPGEPIICKLKVRAGGKPVDHLDKVLVSMVKPGTDVNDLFSNTPTPAKIPDNWPSEPGNYAGQDKFEKLVALDSSFVNKLKSIEFPMPMVNTGNSTFTTIFTDTKESGVYQFIFKFTGHDDVTGTYERYYALSEIIDFGTADITKSIFTLKWSLLKKRFFIKPVNKFGHLLGPNRLSNINLNLNGKKLELIDNLDGTYSAKAPLFLLFKKNWGVKLDIKGQNFADIKLKDILKQKSLFGCLTK
jgi:hypothetical protein